MIGPRNTSVSIIPREEVDSATARECVSLKNIHVCKIVGMPCCVKYAIQDS